MSEKEIWECLDEAILNRVQRKDLSEKDQEEAADSLSIQVIHHHSAETLATIHSGAQW